MVNLTDIKHFWDDDKYLKPFMQDDPLVYSFIEDEDGGDFTAQVDKEELVSDLVNIEEIHLEDDNTGETSATHSENFEGNGVKEVDSVSRGPLNLVAKDIKKVNEKYFGAYSSFGIHREMISDKVLNFQLYRFIPDDALTLKYGCCL